MNIFNVFSLLGGLALFLFGMDIMGKALEKQAGGNLERILSKMTDNTLKGFGLGVIVTAIIQSSSATTVMVVGFVNSGLMKLHQAIGVIMGANVGTTVTSWLLSMSAIDGSSLLVQLLKPSNFSPLLAFIGIILYMFFKSEKKKGVGTILIGFAVLMSGMETMSAAVAPLKDAPWFCEIFIKFQNPIIGVLAGAILTAIIQSSSASVGILQALSATGAITFGSAIPIIMGQNIGTCVTALISSVGTNKNARRASIVHLYFNIVGVVLFLTVFYTADLFFDFAFVNEQVNSVNIAVVHTCFNLTTTMALLPFSTVLEKLAYLTLPEDEKQEEEQFSLLDPRLMEVPAVAADRAAITAGDMAEIVRMNLLRAMSLTRKWDDALREKVDHAEKVIDMHEDALGTYLVQLSKCELSEEDNHTVNLLLHTIDDFERIGDYALNLADSAKEVHDRDVVFSAHALEELEVLEGAVQDIMARTIDSFEKNDLYLAGKVEPLEEVIDGLVREIKARHIARLQSGRCSIESGVLLDELLISYERIADHCSNIAVALIEVSQDSFDTHAYLNAMKNGNEKFSERYEKYRARYFFPEETEE